MTARGLAWRTITSKPGRAALAIAGVAVIGALLFDMLMLSRGLLVSFRDLLDTAGYDVRVVATDTLLARTPIADATRLTADLAALPEVAEVAPIRRQRVTTRGRRASGGPGDTSREPLGVTLVNLPERAEARAWRVVAGDTLGEAPVSGPPALVVSQTMADAMQIAPGSMVRLRSTVRGSSAMPTVEFVVRGIATFALDPGDDLVAATSLDGFRRMLPGDDSDEADLLFVRSAASSDPTSAVAAIAARRPDVHAFSNAQIVTQFNQNAFTYFRQISMVLSTITLGFAFLLIATLLSVSVNQRLNEVAALRALGVPRRRITATLLWESAWLVGAGGLLSLPLGGVLAVQFDRILRQMPGFPVRLHFFVFEWRSIGVHLALVAATAIGAAVYPAWVAHRLPIAATLRRETLT